MRILFDEFYQELISKPKIHFNLERLFRDILSLPFNNDILIISTGHE